MAKTRFKTKLSKAQRRKNILVFLVVIVCAHIFALLFSYAIGALSSWDSWLEILTYSSGITFFILSMLLSPVIVVASLLGFQKGEAKRVRNDSTFVPVMDINYYRDNLSEINPALASLLIDLDIYGAKDIVATLLCMKNKNAISFQENGSIDVTANDVLELDSTEIQLLNYIKNNKMNDKKAMAQWRQNRFRDAEQLGYIKKKNKNYKFIKTIALLGTLSFLCAFVMWGVFIRYNSLFHLDAIVNAIHIIAYFLIMDILVFVPFYLISRETAYLNRGDVVWERTQLGNEMAEKVAGLARFIHEFSRLSEAEKELVALWDDYLVYAIVLEENEKIVKDICKRYKINLRMLKTESVLRRSIIWNLKHWL